MLYKSVRFGYISDYFLRPLPASSPLRSSRSLRLSAAPSAQLRILPALASSLSPNIFHASSPSLAIRHSSPATSPSFSHSYLPRATAKGALQPHLSAEGRDPPLPLFRKDVILKGLPARVCKSCDSKGLNPRRFLPRWTRKGAMRHRLRFLGANFNASRPPEKTNPASR